MLVTNDEIKKASRPDGFFGLFFQHHWDVVGDSVCYVVKHFFVSGFMLKELNHTNIALIPKCKNPSSINEFRPISLCNFFYKVVSKVLVNHLKPWMDMLISQEQAAFIPRHLIQGNITVAHQVFHFLQHSNSRNYSMAIKVDMQKAYD